MSGTTKNARGRRGEVMVPQRKVNVSNVKRKRKNSLSVTA